MSTRLKVLFAVVALQLGAGSAPASLLYDASLLNANFGGGFKVGAYLASSPFNASGSLGGNLGALGIIDSPTGVEFTTAHDVINYSLGADGLGGSYRTGFRTTGTVSVMFRANRVAFVNGQLFVDNFGFDQFASGQAAFGTALIRHNGLDGMPNTFDDRIEFAWNTWHSNVWYDHVDTASDEVVTTFDAWHHLGLTWGGAVNRFEVWLDGQLLAIDNRNLGEWGASYLGRGSAYNFALGEIHQRSNGDNSPRGIMFANLRIWDEVRPLGDTSPPVPEPDALTLVGLFGLATATARGRRMRARRTKRDRFAYCKGSKGSRLAL